MSSDRLPGFGRWGRQTHGDERRSAPESDPDFSRVNVHYLIQARELARRHPARAPVLLGTAERHTSLLAEVPPEALVHLAQIKFPLVVPRQAGWWWTRLLKALADGRPGELETVLEHVELTAIR